MALFKISQFGKMTVRYSFREVMKVMHDRRITNQDKALLRIYCTSEKEAMAIIKNKLFIEECTHVFLKKEDISYIWFDNEWVSEEDFFEDDETIY